MPETHTVTVDDLDGVVDWARQNASPADLARINAIIDAFGTDKVRQFSNQPALWEIEWLYRGSAKEFYRLALINPDTQHELWGYS